MKSNILVVTRKDLFPTDHGAAVKIIRTAESLSRLGQDVVLCTDERHQYYLFSDGVTTIQAYPLWLRWLALPRPVALLRLLLAGFPWSNAFLYFPLKDISYTLRSYYLAKRHHARAYLAEFPGYVSPLLRVRRKLGGRIVLCEHNVEYQRLQAQLSQLSERSYQALRQFELAMCHASDAVVVVSATDRQQLTTDGIPLNKLHLIPHGVDLHAFWQARATQTTQINAVRESLQLKPTALLLVYHGTYGYPPNMQAMQFMAQEVLPRLEQRGMDVAVLAIGSKPPAVPLHPRMHFVGSVPQLETMLPAADMAVVSLLEGGGTRMKILDYFAARVPVISTSKGIEGIPVINNQEAMIRDGADALCEAVVELAGDKAKALTLTDAAYKFVETLSWDSITQRYLPLLLADTTAVVARSPVHREDYHNE
jgi:glycosyltransferase involved in cell wall biosynthesis